jgi:hypothetical protein
MNTSMNFIESEKGENTQRMTQSYTMIHNLSTIKEKALTNLIMRIRFQNWELKGIVYKILENRIRNFKVFELRDLLKFIQMDLTVFCEQICTGDAYVKDEG